MEDARLAAYARLVVLTGTGLQPDQELLVHASLEHAPLVRAISVQAYRAGPRYVDVLYSDPWMRRALVDHAPEDSLGWTPPWMVERLERATQRGRCRAGDRGRLARRGVRGGGPGTPVAGPGARVRPRVDRCGHVAPDRVGDRGLPGRGVGA
jgi:hypothetical protein